MAEKKWYTCMEAAYLDHVNLIHRQSRLCSLMHCSHPDHGPLCIMWAWESSTESMELQCKWSTCNLAISKAPLSRGRKLIRAQYTQVIVLNEIKKM